MLCINWIVLTESLCSLHESDVREMLAAEEITFGQSQLLNNTLEELRKPSATANESAPEAVTEAVPGSCSQPTATVDDPRTSLAAVLHCVIWTDV